MTNTMIYSIIFLFLAALSYWYWTRKFVNLFGCSPCDSLHKKLWAKVGYFNQRLHNLILFHAPLSSNHFYCSMRFNRGLYSY